MFQVAATKVYLKMSIDTHLYHNRSVIDLIHSTCGPQVKWSHLSFKEIIYEKKQSFKKSLGKDILHKEVST